MNYYSSMIPGFPTVIFDGVTNSVGGGGNMYPTYLSKYNSRISVPSSYTIDVEGTNSGLIDYELEITIEKVASGIDNPKMHIAVVESHIPENWGGLTEVNFTERLMAPNQNGTTLDFSSSNTEEIIINFSCDPSWVNENCEVVIFLQNNSTKEVLQGIKRDLSDFGTTNVNDAAVLGVIAPQTVCNESFIPRVEIANYGLDNLTSLDFCIYVNGTASCTLPWTGDLAYLETEIVVFPEITFTIEPDNILMVEAENPNGQPDEYPSNNTYTINMDEAPNVAGPVSLIMLLDDNPEETTWKVLNSQGNILYEGGPYTPSTTTVIEQFDITGPDCYSFIIYDDGGDGLTEGGVYKLYDGNSTVFYQANNFGMEDHVQFGIGLTGTEEIIISDGFEIFPNPVDDKANISFVMEKPGYVQYKIYNYTGAVVIESGEQHCSAGIQTLSFVTGNLNSGIYIVEFRMPDKVFSKQIVVNR
ncbi:MAG: T9SS type A sorting domain-containing protein [Bacteroidales bacterium]|nr:T9SS type A sorting domain-containing protein [Bacteroidales bacterium]